MEAAEEVGGKLKGCVEIRSCSRVGLECGSYNCLCGSLNVDVRLIIWEFSMAAKFFRAVEKEVRWRERGVEDGFLNVD